MRVKVDIFGVVCRSKVVGATSSVGFLVLTANYKAPYANSHLPRVLSEGLGARWGRSGLGTLAADRTMQ